MPGFAPTSAVDADRLIGKTGVVRPPHKPMEWDGKYRVVGYSLAKDDPSKAESLKLESTVIVPEVVKKNARDVVVKRIPAHPKDVAPAVPPAWFYPDVPLA